MRRKIVAYYRVSTDKQGRSKLGLEAQKEAVKAYAAREKCIVVAEFIEIETGKRSDRPELANAIACAEAHKATLVVAKLDRLARNARFLLSLVEGPASIAFCDLPQIAPGPQGKFQLTIMAAVAELEAGLISQRTKDGLKAYREGRHVSERIQAIYPDGVPAEVVEATAGKLGASLPQCRNLTPEARRRGAERSAAVRKEAADKAVAYLVPKITAMWQVERLSLRAIATRLNAAEQGAADEATDEETPVALTWSAMRVKRVLNRAGCLTARSID
jgi:DNA invertase Pin-like site-specific DNA recombinase